MHMQPVGAREYEKHTDHITDWRELMKPEGKATHHDN